MERLSNEWFWLDACILTSERQTDRERGGGGGVGWGSSETARERDRSGGGGGGGGRKWPLRLLQWPRYGIQRQTAIPTHTQRKTRTKQKQERGEGTSDKGHKLPLRKEAATLSTNYTPAQRRLQPESSWHRCRSRRHTSRYSCTSVKPRRSAGPWGVEPKEISTGTSHDSTWLNERGVKNHPSWCT